MIGSWIELVLAVRALGVDAVLPLVRAEREGRRLDALRGAAAGRAAGEASRGAGLPCASCGATLADYHSRDCRRAMPPCLRCRSREGRIRVDGLCGACAPDD